MTYLSIMRALTPPRQDDGRLPLSWAMPQQIQQRSKQGQRTGHRSHGQVIEQAGHGGLAYMPYAARIFSTATKVPRFVVDSLRYYCSTRLVIL